MAILRQRPTTPPQSAHTGVMDLHEAARLDLEGQLRQRVGLEGLRHSTRRRGTRWSTASQTGGWGTANPAGGHSVCRREAGKCSRRQGGALGHTCLWVIVSYITTPRDQMSDLLL